MISFSNIYLLLFLLYPQLLDKFKLDIIGRHDWFYIFKNSFVCNYNSIFIKILSHKIKNNHLIQLNYLFFF